MPVAEILRQRLRAGHVDLAASRLRNRAIASEKIGEEILGFTLARVAQSDPQPLALWHRIDVDSGFDSELRQRIDVGGVEQTGAALIGNAEAAHVGEAAAAPAVARFEDHEFAS